MHLFKAGLHSEVTRRPNERIEIVLFLVMSQDLKKNVFPSNSSTEKRLLAPLDELITWDDGEGGKGREEGEKGPKRERQKHP